MGCGGSFRKAVGDDDSLAQEPPGLAPRRSGHKGSCRIIPDRFTSFEQVSTALRNAGLEASQLIIGIDFTKSNTWTGRKSFDGRCLHEKGPNGATPYEQVMRIMCSTLEPFDEDNMIPTYGFGDKNTKNRRVFSFLPGNKACKGIADCVARYSELARELLGPPLMLSGPTSFAPLVHQAMQLVHQTGEYHILAIVADGQVDSLKETVQAIVDASLLPLSIIMVGVGDGPWDKMREFDDGLPERAFDNFQFVEFAALSAMYPQEKREYAFAAHALMEIPDQYRTVLKLGYMDEAYRERMHLAPPTPPLDPPDVCFQPCPEPCSEDF